MRRVVVTGLGTINPCGKNVSQTWDRIIQSECGVNAIGSFDASGLPVQIAAEVQDFEFDKHINKKNKNVKFSSKLN